MAGTRKHLTRGLRFVLTASYALFFATVMIFLSIIFRQALASYLDSQIRTGLEQDFAAVKGYLRIEDGKVIWHFDPQDPEEAAIIGRLRRVFRITDSAGSELQSTDAYRSIGPETPAQIRAVLAARDPQFRESRDTSGNPYLIRAGYVFDENDRDRRSKSKYFVAIARSLGPNHEVLRRFTVLCMEVIPLSLLGGCWMGWIFAGRALRPVLEVARTAQRITGSNLSMRIPTRESGDELDYLIETFNRMIERLESSFNQIRQFSTDVSHELRTPLTILRGQLEVALFTAETKEQYREAIIDSLQDIDRLSQIIRALLLLSQAETGQVTLQKASEDLGAVVRDLAEQFEIPAEGAQVALQVEVPPEPLTVRIDRVQFERMLSNLLSNAMKFTPPGGTVKVSLAQKDGHAELKVADTGRGIPAKHLPHIFDRFYRVSSGESSSPEKGLGLGLSFVAWIAKAHDGEIHVNSEPAKGTTFTVDLPL